MADPTPIQSEPPLEVLPRDLAAYREGNTGIPYVHRFASGHPGPHVLVIGLTHGNELCGMTAVTHLLDRGVRPSVGTLTLALANVGAYESFDRADPFASRQLVHNLNRIWSPEWLDGGEDSPELRRARELRPIVEAADHLLDLHSTSHAVHPFWVYPGFERNAKAALAIGRPSVHLVMPSGLGSGTPVIQYGANGTAQGTGVAVVVECGQHFARATSDLAVEVAQDFITHFGLIEPETPPHEREPQRRFELLRTFLVRTPQFRFVRPVVGFEEFAQGELIATDGPDEIRSPCDRCTIFMPTRSPIVGREAVYLTRPL